MRDANRDSNIRWYSAWRAMFFGEDRRSVGERISLHSSALHLSYTNMVRERREVVLRRQRSVSIASSDLSFNFNAMSWEDCHFNFRFNKEVILRMVRVMGWYRSSTLRNRYAVTPLLATCFSIRRVASPDRWRVAVRFFGKHASQLGEIFLEGMEVFLEKRGHLLIGPLNDFFIGGRAERYARGVMEQTQALDNVIGFIDETVIEIAKPGDEEQQRVVYNGHKVKHALKYQIVSAPEGMILHVYGHIKGRRQDWTLWLRRGFEEQLLEMLMIHFKQYCIYRDSCHNDREFLSVPAQDSSLIPAQQTLNTAMTSARFTVQWIFKQFKQYWTVADVRRKLM